MFNIRAANVPQQGNEMTRSDVGDVASTHRINIGPGAYVLDPLFHSYTVKPSCYEVLENPTVLCNTSNDRNIETESALFGIGQVSSRYGDTLKLPKPQPVRYSAVQKQDLSRLGSHVRARFVKRDQQIGVQRNVVEASTQLYDPERWDCMNWRSLGQNTRNEFRDLTQSTCLSPLVNMR